MHYFFLAVLVVALLFLATRQPRLAFGILGGLLLAVVIAIYVTGDDGKLSRAKISPDLVEINHMSAQPSYGGSYKLTGRITNKHETSLLKEVVISVTLKDCDDTNQTCATIGQLSERINIQIPAGQSRDVSESLNFGTVEPTGTLSWEFQVTQTRS